VLVCALALIALAPVGAPAVAGDQTQAAALAKCKKGLNAKKCKCKKGYSLKRSGTKYKCVKKKAPAQTDPNGGGAGTGTGTGTGEGGTGTGTGTGSGTGSGTGTGEGGTGTGTGSGTGTGTTNPPAQPVRDDAGFTAALSDNSLRKYEEGSYGYGRYAYNFFSDGQFLYCSYYYAGSTVESNSAGTWQVLEGYRDSADPNYFGGAVRVTLSNGSFQNFGVEVRGNQGYVVLPQGQSSSSWTTGTFARSQPAIGNCSQIQ
jgi:hypothetical protein